METLTQQWTKRKEQFYAKLQLYQENQVLFDEIQLSLGEDVEVTVPESAYSSYYYIGFTGNKAKLEHVWKVLRRLGFKTDDTPPGPNSPTWSGFWYHENKPDIALYTSFTSSVCERVKVGTKLVEQDVYEVRCNDN